MRQFRVGIVGCGEAAQILHLPSLYQLADKFNVTALCDASNAVLQGVGEHWRVSKRFLDYRELVAQDDVDIVLIANPNAYHADITLAAIQAGKHVLVEKPMCMTMREAECVLAGRGFIRIHRRFLVNGRKICVVAGTKGDRWVRIGGNELPVGRRYAVHLDG